MGNSKWLMDDSGATNHITANQSNITQKNEYSSSERLIAGNGQGLSIMNFGSSSFQTSSGIFWLNNMLHVPHITKNLLSIVHVTLDNNVVEFNSQFVFVMDKDSRMT